MPFPFFGPSKQPGQTQRPILRRPAPKTKPEQKPKPGILGDKGFRSFVQMREFAKKAPFKSIPKYAKKFSQKERVSLIGDLRKYSGQSFGLSEQKYNLAIKKMQKEKMQAGYKKDYKKIKELDQKIKQFEAWKKG